MKNKLTRILGAGLAIAFLGSLMVAAPIAADISEPVADIDDEEISSVSEYVITFDVNDEIVDDVDGWIEIRFPEDTVVADNFTDDDITVQSTAGFGVANPATGIPTANVTVTEDDDVYTVLIGIEALADPIGEGAMVRVTFTETGGQVKNPSDIGEYTLEVRTSEEDDWVESEVYDIDPRELTGVVTLYNPSNLILNTFTGADAIQDALDEAGEDFTIIIGPGTYNEATIVVPADAEDVDIEASGTAAETIVDGNWTVNAEDAIITGLSIEGTITVSADDVTLENLVFEEESGAATQIVVNAITGTDLTIDGCTFDVTDDASLGIDVNCDDTTISNCTFTVEDDTTAIDTANETDVEDCVITGGSDGVGIEASAATADVTIERTTFDALENAVDVVAGAEVKIDSCTIENCIGDNAIYVEDATEGEVVIINCIIQDNEDDVLEVDGGADNITMVFNSLLDNEENINNDDTDVDLIATNNWWGSVDGPDTDTLSDDVVYEPWMGSASSDAEVSTNDDELEADDTAGVDVKADAAVAVIAASKYAANPQSDTPAPAIGFYDVYVSDPDENAEKVTIRLYGDVSEYTLAYMWSEVQGVWVKCEQTDPDDSDTQGVSLFGGYVWITVEDDGTVPSIEDLAGAPFALLQEVEEGVLDVGLISPEMGSEDIPLKPTFTWTAVEDVIGYELAVAEDSTFAILDYSSSAALNAHVTKEELKYGTSYYWRVRAITGVAEPKMAAPGGPWSTGVFTTMEVPEPEEPAVITITEPAPPAPPAEVVTIEVPTPAPPPMQQAIPSYLLWTIIVIGAVLIIALIVLIVRTRRVA